MMINQDLLITWGAIHKKIRKRQIIFYEGDPVIYYQQIVQGRVKLVNVGENSKEIIQGFFNDGESFGETPLFCNGLYPASAIAMEETVLLRLTKESFMVLINDNKSLLMKFAVLFANRLREQALQLKNLASNETETKICNVLDEYKLKMKTDIGQQIKIDMTRQDIADLTGLRVETVIRSIKRLEGKGLLKISTGKIFY